ncbi:MAG: hypothetical protein P4L31_06195 [Candidatus Babeliales bacterium]|nr:hypothetical protein [Candidatus Babeliales bacterium]
MMNTKNLISYSSLMALVISSSGCLHLPPYRMKRKKVIIAKHTSKRHKKTVDSSPQTPTLTIWIHGTRLLPSPIFRAYMYSPAGLNPVTTLDSSYHLRQLADAIIESDPTGYPLDHFYVFGWSGKLNALEREQAAQRLYDQLINTRTAYEQTHGIRPHIRIITHSHGGNIALQLARLKKPQDNLEIHKLVLLACPVQKKTMHYLEDPMFGKVYSLYSSLDMLQILAPQFFYRIERKNGNKKDSELKIPFFSDRRFGPSPKLAQIKIKLNGRAIFHTKFTSTAFTRLLPHLLDEVDNWQLESQQYPHDKPDTRRLMSIYG